MLHITSDRTPSIEFRVISPTDPISQQEWAKQMAVKRVRPKPGLNNDGLPDDKAEKDTIEVSAFFDNEDGFFGLTSYLSYAADQLKKSYEWVSQTKKSNLAPHNFPWRRIDDSNIETIGFIRDTFEFTVDQAKILDLLTGHTLYNDTRVVIRELVQNAIDAVRLYAYPIVALANLTGHSAPKTNVARSGIEATPERDQMLRGLYSLYINHVARELQELKERRSFSLTWAVSESQFLLNPLLNPRESNMAPLSESILDETLTELPALIVENSEQRTTISAKNLAKQKEFWTIECGLFRSAEPLIREAATSASIVQIIKSLKLPHFEVPAGMIHCGSSPYDALGCLAYKMREVDKILINTEQRRIDLRWVEKLSPPRWISIPEESAAILNQITNRRQLGFQFRSYQNESFLLLGNHSIDVQPKIPGMGVRASGKLFLFPDSGVVKFIKPYFEKAISDKADSNIRSVVYLCSVIERFAGAHHLSDVRNIVRQVIRSIDERWRPAPDDKSKDPAIDEEALTTFVATNDWQIFDPNAWSRGNVLANNWW